MDTVSVVMVGTVRALILSVLVDVALLNEVIVPELLRFTMPPALLVMPAIVPDPPRLRMPVLVKLARTVEIAPPLVTVTVPALVRVPIEQVPPIFKLWLAVFVNIPVPASAVLAVMVPLFVSVTPVTVRSVPTVNVPELA